MQAQQMKKSHDTLLMSLYMAQKAIRRNNGIGDSSLDTPAVPLGSTVVDPPPTFNLRKTVWSSHSNREILPMNSESESAEGELSTMKLQDESLPEDKRKLFRCTVNNICSPKCKAFLYGLTIGLLLAGIILAVVLTIWLKTGTHKTMTTGFSNTSTTSGSTFTTSTSTSSTSTTETTTTSSTSTTSTTTTTTTSKTTTTSTASSTTTSTTSSTTTSTTSSTTTSTTSSTTTSTTSSTTTMTTTTTTTALTCISSLTGATILLNLTNVASQSYTLYSYNYTALTTSTRLTLSFRMDSNNWSLDTLSVKQVGTSTELLSNGDFESGTMNGWLSCNLNSAASSGFIQNNFLFTYSGSYYWKDGSTGAADYLYQYFSSVVGANYAINFYLKGDGGLPNSAVVYIGS